MASPMLLHICSPRVLPLVSLRGWFAPVAGYAKKAGAPGIPSLGKGVGKKGKLGPALEKKVLPVETDASRLVTHLCGSNLLKEGGEDVKLQPDEAYPEWLWSTRTGPPPPLEELDPESLEYWRRIRRMGIKQQNQLKKGKKF